MVNGANGRHGKPAVLHAAMGPNSARVPVPIQNHRSVDETVMEGLPNQEDVMFDLVQEVRKVVWSGYSVQS